MSNLSDTGLILCIAGTTISVASFLFSIIISPALLNLQIVSGAVFIIAIIVLSVTKNEYRIFKTKSGFPLKTDHLIIFVCAMLLMAAFFLWININHYIFTGEISYFTLVPACYLILALVFVSVRTNKYNLQSGEKDSP
jgi:hypothetical protein